LISHRLSALSSADLILVLADGQISESGTPAALMSAGGSFAQLYALQAEGYHLASAEAVAGEIAVAEPGA
jgi:ATP-binding cassette subfamily B protein